LSINTQFGTTFDLIRFVPPHMGLPGFLLGWGSKIRSSRAQSKLRGSDKKISEGEGVIFIVGYRPGFLWDFDETWPKCVIRSNLDLIYFWTLCGCHGKSFMWGMWKNTCKMLVFVKPFCSYGNKSQFHNLERRQTLPRLLWYATLQDRLHSDGTVNFWMYDFWLPNVFAVE